MIIRHGHEILQSIQVLRTLTLLLTLSHSVSPKTEIHHHHYHHPSLPFLQVPFKFEGDLWRWQLEGLSKEFVLVFFTITFSSLLHKISSLAISYYI
uniref:Uncharacterized protein n=1 Tax=Helianthus annuus TaxID=4232 RepID=A0A251UAN0_HELAN